VKFGFAFRETMRGTYYLLADPTNERAMRFTVSVRAKGLRAFAREPVASIEGQVSCEGFATDKPLVGTLAFRLHDQKRLVYEFRFGGDDGKAYRFRGQKDVTPLAPIESFTTLPGSLYDESSKEIGRATVHFDLRGDWKKFVRSFRLVY
jgi:hypothetical protein